jgi:hypothetical protein
MFGDKSYYSAALVPSTGGEASSVTASKTAADSKFASDAVTVIPLLSPGPTIF